MWNAQPAWANKRETTWLKCEFYDCRVISCWWHTIGVSYTKLVTGDRDVYAGNRLQLCYQNAVYRVPAHLSWSESDRRIGCHLLHEGRRQVFCQWWSWNRYCCNMSYSKTLLLFINVYTILVLCTITACQYMKGWLGADIVTRNSF